MVVPIEGGRASDDIRVLQNRRIIGGCKIRARLKQEDAAACIVAKSGRKNRAGRSAAYNNDVEGLVGSMGPCSGWEIPCRHLHDPSFFLSTFPKLLTAL